MSHQDKNNIEISAENVLEKLEQLSGKLKLKWILLATGAGMLFYIIIFVGSFTSNSVPDLPGGISNDVAPPSTPAPIVEYAEVPAQIIEATDNDSSYSAAHDIGVQTGEILITSRDAIINFWHGFDESTGASDWAKEQWASGRERMTGWLEENLQSSDSTDDDFNDDDYHDFGDSDHTDSDED